MAFSSNLDRQRYTQELAAYTLRQFSSASAFLDPAKRAAMNRLSPVNHRIFLKAEKAEKEAASGNCFVGS